MTNIIYKLNTTTFLKIVGWFYQVNDSILIRLQVIEIDSKVLKKSLNFLKKSLNFLKKSLNFLKKTLHFLKKTLNFFKKTLKFSKITLSFFKKTHSFPNILSSLKFLEILGFYRLQQNLNGLLMLKGGFQVPFLIAR